jgi:hypothetical protein
MFGDGYRALNSDFELFGLVHLHTLDGVYCSAAAYLVAVRWYPDEWWRLSFCCPLHLYLAVESRYVNYDNSAVMTCSPLLYIVPMLSVQNSAKRGRELAEANIVGLLNYWMHFIRRELQVKRGFLRSKVTKFTFVSKYTFPFSLPLLTGSISFCLPQDFPLCI